MLTLTNILSKYSTGDRKDILVQQTIVRATTAICTHQGIAAIKPAIQALEHFLEKDVVNAIEIVETSSGQIESAHAIEQAPQPPLSEADASNLSRAQRIEATEGFVSCVLEWVQYPDCAPAVGRFLPTFFKSLEAIERELATTPRSTPQPLWISPVKQNLKRRPGLLEAYENHILPELLRLGAAHTTAFLSILPLEDLQRGNVGSHEVADIQMCLLVASISSGFNSGTVALEYAGGNTAARILDEGCRVSDDTVSKVTVITDAERLGMSLLEHAASSVRISALSLLVSPSISIKLFSRQVFDRLRVCLPLFQVEVNPKTRNEFIALMKRFFIRLRGATISLLRSGHGLPLDEHCTQGSNEDTTMKDGQQTDGVQGDIDSHLAFRSWYILFLLDELRPTASYQSHITALKILHSTYDGELTGRSSLSKVNHEYSHALAETNRRGVHLRLLSDLLLDPFDDVRQTAADILEIDLGLNPTPSFPISRDDVESIAQSGRDANSTIHSTLSKAESQAARTGRADHADGVGRLYNLLYSSSLVLNKMTAWYDCNYLIVERLLSALENGVLVAQDHLPSAVGSASTHGHLIALRYDCPHRVSLYRELMHFVGTSPAVATISNHYMLPRRQG